VLSPVLDKRNKHQQSIKEKATVLSKHLTNICWNLQDYMMTLMT